MDREECLAWRTHKANARAFMLLRSYIPTGIRVMVTDPQDPTPYLYLSTRGPERLAQAIVAAKAEAASGSRRRPPRQARAPAQQRRRPSAGSAGGAEPGLRRPFRPSSGDRCGGRAAQVATDLLGQSWRCRGG